MEKRTKITVRDLNLYYGENHALKDVNMKSIQWMCTKCGQKQTRTASTGRPMPGRCSRSKTGGPHRWVKNMTIGK